MNALKSRFIGGSPGPSDWVRASLDKLNMRGTAVLAMITEGAGSTPRDQGAWMLVSSDATLGTLGGGQLEKMAEDAAREMLHKPDVRHRAILRYMLGPDARQCCGGYVAIVLELLDTHAFKWLKKAEESIQNDTADAVMFPTNDLDATPRVILAGDRKSGTPGVYLQSLQDSRPRLFLFGAGHVGRAICVIASQLPLRLVVLDSRQTMRVRVPYSHNVAVANMNGIQRSVESIPRNSAVLVMTHSHDLDYELCRTLLVRHDLKFIGLIGSRSKGSRFRQRLRREGFSKGTVDHLNCPIGSDTLASKEPGVIALSTLLQILAVFEDVKTRRQIEANPNLIAVQNQ